MPRSTIRLPNSKVDWQPWFSTVDQLPAQLSSQSLFGNDLPLEIEIGSGKGLFMASVSTGNPGHNFMGIEIADRYARHAAGRIATAHGAFLESDQNDQSSSDQLSSDQLSSDQLSSDQLSSDQSSSGAGTEQLGSGGSSENTRRNALMVSGDAEPLFLERIEPGSLEAVHVYFPDPWWKKRHRKRRVVNETSVLSFLKALRSGGRFHFWTDVLDYFELTIEMIAEIAPEFGIPLPEEELESSHDLDFHTHFERRSRKNAIPVYRVRYQKQ